MYIHGDCEKTYIGQSGRSLACRMKEHQGAVRRGASAIAEHVWGEQHQIDWGSAEVLDTNPSWRPRTLLESWHIHKERGTMNRDHGNLPPDLLHAPENLLFLHHHTCTLYACAVTDHTHFYHLFIESSSLCSSFP